MLVDVAILSTGLIVLASAGGFALKAATDLQKNLSIESDTELQSARSYLIWSAILIGLAFLMVIAALIISIIYKDRLTSGTFKFLLIGIVALTWLLIIIGGGLAAYAATKANKKKANGGGWATTSAVLLLVLANLMFLGYLVYCVIRRPTIVDFYKSNIEKGLKSAKRIFGKDKDRPKLPKDKQQEKLNEAQLAAAAEIGRRQGLAEANRARQASPVASTQPNQRQSALSQALSQQLAQ